MYWGTDVSTWVLGGCHTLISTDIQAPNFLLLFFVCNALLFCCCKDFLLERQIVPILRFRKFQHYSKRHLKPRFALSKACSTISPSFPGTHRSLGNISSASIATFFISFSGFGLERRFRLLSLQKQLQPELQAIAVTAVHLEVLPRLQSLKPIQREMANEEKMAMAPGSEVAPRRD